MSGASAYPPCPLCSTYEPERSGPKATHTIRPVRLVLTR